MSDKLFYDTLANNIKQARKDAGVTQTEMADYLGMHRTAFTQIELGNRKVSTLEITKMAQRLCIPVWELIPGVAND